LTNSDQQMNLGQMNITAKKTDEAFASEAPEK
jgi:hypothetical protein